MRTLFLDLEDTVITPVPHGWHDFEIINLSTVKGIIERFEPDRVEIFSFAIHNEYEKAQFNKHTRPFLEKMLGVCFSSVPTVDVDIKEAVCRQKAISPEHTSFSDMCDFWGKDLSFQLYIQEKYKSANDTHEILFLDDAVKNSVFQSLDKTLTAYTLNIDDFVRKFENMCDMVPFLNPVVCYPSNALKLKF